MPYKSDSKSRKYSLGEIVANGVTHGIGIILSIIGLVFLILRAVQQGTAWHIVSFAIFGTSMLFLYLASTIYHITPNKWWNATLQRLDHAAIFLLIAGTYTPFLLTNLRGAWGWSIFGVVWGLTVVGFVLKFAFTSKFQKPPVVLYILMGWLVVIAFGEVVRNFSGMTLMLLVWGGILYTAGVVFYAWEKLPYSHAIWHLFVLGGTIMHYFSVMNIL
jgi:hemolysin III